MFDIDQMMQPHIDRIRPVAQSAAMQARAWGDRALSRLDAIHDAVREDPADSYLERPVLYLDADETGAVEIPAGEWWDLEAVTIIPDVIGTPGSIVLGVTLALPMFGAPHAGRPVTVGGNRVRFESGTTVRVIAAEAAAVVAFQFRVLRPANTRPGLGGQPETGTTGGPSTGYEPRHTQSFRARP